jgi:hypothetical protein
MSEALHADAKSQKAAARELTDQEAPVKSRAPSIAGYVPTCAEYGDVFVAVIAASEPPKTEVA